MYIRPGYGVSPPGDFYQFQSSHHHKELNSLQSWFLGYNRCSANLWDERTPNCLSLCSRQAYFQMITPMKSQVIAQIHRARYLVSYQLILLLNINKRALNIYLKPYICTRKLPYITIHLIILITSHNIFHKQYITVCSNLPLHFIIIIHYKRYVTKHGTAIRTWARSIEKFQ
jgi:hypothetical protein